MRYISTFRELDRHDLYESKLLKFNGVDRIDEQFWDAIERGWEATKNAAAATRDALSPLVRAAAVPGGWIFGSLINMDSVLENEDYHDYYSWASAGISMINVPIFPGYGISVGLDILHSLSYAWMAYGTKRNGQNFWKTEEDKNTFIALALIEASLAILPGTFKIAAKEIKAAVRLGKMTPKLTKIFSKVARSSTLVISKLKKLIGQSEYLSPDTIAKLNKILDEVEGAVQLYNSRKSKIKGDIPKGARPLPTAPSGVTADVVTGVTKRKDALRNELKKEVMNAARAEQKNLLKGQKSAIKVSAEARKLAEEAVKRTADYKFIDAIWEASPGVCRRILSRMGFKEGEEVGFAIFKGDTWQALKGQVVKMDEVLNDTDEVYDLVNMTIKPAKDATAKIGQGMVEMIINGKNVKVSYPDFLKHVLQIGDEAAFKDLFKNSGKIVNITKALIRMSYIDFLDEWAGIEYARWPDEGASAEGGSNQGGTEQGETQPKPQETTPKPQETQPKPQETQPKTEGGQNLPAPEPVYVETKKEVQKEIETYPKYDPNTYNPNASAERDNFLEDMSNKTNMDRDDISEIISNMGGMSEFNKKVGKLSEETGKSSEECKIALIEKGGKYSEAKESLGKAAQKPKVNQQGSKISDFDTKGKLKNPSLAGRNDEYIKAFNKLKDEFPDNDDGRVINALDKSATEDGKIKIGKARAKLKDPKFQPGRQLPK